MRTCHVYESVIYLRDVYSLFGSFVASDSLSMTGVYFRLFMNKIQSKYILSLSSFEIMQRIHVCM